MRHTVLLLLLALFAQTGMAQVSSRFKAKLTNSSTAIQNNKGKTAKEKKQSLAGHERPKQVESTEVQGAYTALEADNYDAAIQELDQYDDSDADAAFGLGLAYYETDRLDDAVQALKHAIELDPTQTDALYVLGLVYEDMGNFEAAGDAFIQVLEVDEHHADAWYELGRLFFDEGFTDDADFCLEQARTSDPSDTFEAYQN